jgi:hypothetical protein
MGLFTRLLYATVAAALLLCPHFLFAQQRNNEQYKKYAAEVQKEVWAWDIPAFKQPNLAAADSKASAVILAKHEEITGSTQKKLRGNLVFGYSVEKDLIYTTTVRQMVKINDKAALEEYSELSYQQFEGYKWRGATTIIGARILKTNGTIKEVNIDESVLLKDEKTDKQRKLAISDLQVGDVLDYFVRVEKIDSYGSEKNSELFLFGDDKPLLHYSVHCEFSNKYAIEYRSMNDAPEFKIKRNDDNDIIMDLEMKNIPARPLSLWMSPYRQLPIVRMIAMIGGWGNRHKSGEVYRNPELDYIKDNVRVDLKSRKPIASRTFFAASVEKHIKLYNKMYNTTLPKDSIPYFMYYCFRYLNYCGIQPWGPIEVDRQRNYWRPKDDNWYVYYMAWVLSELNIPHEFVLATSKYGPAQKDIMSADDYVYILRTKTDKPVLMSSAGLFTHCAAAPSVYEGQQAPTIDAKSLKIEREHDNEPLITIPESTASDNIQLEKMTISLESNMQQALVKRTTILKGHMREDEQRSLVLFEDYYDMERKAVGDKESFMEEYSKNRKLKNLAEEYTNAFEKARKENKEQFIKEITAQFDLAPKELKSFHVDKMALRHTDPDFVFSTEFTMDGWVKKAGNNYILDAGKLIGGQLQLKPEQRKRDVDIYMPFARSFNYNIELLIPAGYQLEGVEQLNQKVDNDCGSFIVTASTEQNKLLLNVKKVYKHAFEPAAKWPDILKVLDAATDFGSRKLLIKKG